MKKSIIALIIMAVFMATVPFAFSHNPFTAEPETQHPAPTPFFKSPVFAKIIVWQHQLKQKMSDLIREARTTGNFSPLLVLMVLSFGYGAIHAAGPGHGKFVAVSYVLSHKISVAGGALFGVFIAFIHGFAGAAGVLGLRYIIDRNVSDTLGTVTHATQIISFGLIALLGLGIFFKCGFALMFKPASEPAENESNLSKKGLLPWAAAVGLVPCPAVVMVMLFCLSMDVLILGIILSICISFGMAATICLAVFAVAMGKAGVLQTIPKKRVKLIENTIGLVSGMAVMVFGAVFCIAAMG